MKHYHRSILILAAVILGLLIPSAQALKGIIPYFLGLLLFFNFLKLEISFKDILTYRLLYFLVFVLGIYPFLFMWLNPFKDIWLQTGCFLILITPTAFASPVMANLIQADGKLIINALVFSNLLAPFYYPVLLSLYFEQSVTIPYSQIIIKLAALVLLPLLLSRLVRKNQKLYKNLAKYSSFSFFIFLFLIFLAIAAASSHLLEMPSSKILYIFLIVFSIALLLFVTPYLFLEKLKIKKALSLHFGNKNTTLAIWLVLTYFDERAAIPIALYIVSHHIVNSSLLIIFKPKN